jgi:hypothetical protein
MPFIAVNREVQLALDQAERSVAATGQALVLGNPDKVHSATRDLHDSAHALALVLRGADSGAAMAASLRGRLVRVAQGIAMQREALLRRSAAVELSLKSLMPQQNQSATYAGALGRYAGRAASSQVFRTF